MTGVIRSGITGTKNVFSYLFFGKKVVQAIPAQVEKLEKKGVLIDDVSPRRTKRSRSVTAVTFPDNPKALTPRRKPPTPREKTATEPKRKRAPSASRKR